MTSPYVIDLHAHFPMQLDPEAKRFRAAMRRRARHQEKLSDRLKFKILEIADRFWNRESPLDGHAITIDTLARGNVGVAFSVMYCPFDELDIEEPYGSPPRDSYFESVHHLLRAVEAAVASDERAQIVRTFAELEAARAAGKVAMIHAIEGGLHLGRHDAAIERHVEKLAALGLGYVTVAHLFFRDVATNAPALPFLSDAIYGLLFPQKRHLGLTARGRTLVTALARNGVLIDVTHMSERSMEETFDLLDVLDPAKKVPVIASHIACASPGGFAYNLGKKWVQKIAERKGMCGIIYCDHYVRDSVGQRTRTFAETFALMKEQIRRLRDWGGDDVLAIGSDLDGFIKPALAGLTSAVNHKDFASALVTEYGEPLARKICHENALRVLDAGWRKGV